MRYGTDEQKEYFLPRILKGDLHFSIGYSEPGSGTDLASLKTRAVREGDEWVINGQKMWTSLIQYADWIWLACRTDPDLPRHKGLSMILVPADAARLLLHARCTPSPGVSTSATYYEDVRVPAANLVGELNGGWSLMTNQLNHERVALTSAAPLTYSIDMVRRWAQETKNPDGQRVIDSEWVQIALGRAHARIDGARADQLEARRRRRRRRRPLARRGVGHQDLRLGARHRGLPLADGDRRAQRRHHRRLRGRGARRPPRALLPLRPGDDLRRRHQRDPARHHRVRRPRPPRSEEETDMDFSFTAGAGRGRRAGRRDPQGPRHQRAAQGRRGRRRPVRPRAVGRARLGRAARPRAPRGVRRRRARPHRALPGAGRGRPHGRAGPAGRPRPGLAADRRARHRRAEAAVAARRGVRRQRADRRGRRGARLLPRSGRPPWPRPTATAYVLTGSKAIVPAGPYADAVPGARPRPRPASASSWSSPATRASPWSPRRSPTATRVARLDLDGVVARRRPAGRRGRRRGRPAAAPAAGARRLGRAARHHRGRAAS